MSSMMGPGEDGRMPGRNLLGLVSNFSPHDVYENQYIASAINSSAAASDPFFSFSF